MPVPPECIYRLRVVGPHRVHIPTHHNDGRYLFKPGREYRMSALRFLEMRCESEHEYAHIICRLAIDQPGGDMADLKHSTYAQMVGFDQTMAEAYNTVVKLNDELHDRLRLTDAPVFSLWATGIACAIMYGEQAVWDSENDDRELVGVCKCVEPGEDGGPDLDCKTCGGEGKDEPQESIETYVRRAVLMHAKQTIEGLG